ncbi:MAG: ribonuclease PH [Candidatus Anammoxibacter sp.]
MRTDNRKPDELRPVKIDTNFTTNAPGSVLIQSGNTKILCTVSVDEAVPPHVKGSGKGWVTAEYSLLPGSTHKRSVRDSSRSKSNGRTLEIQRLIGRSMRSIVKLSEFGERTIWIDCDVLQADGGTRTTAITGSYVALINAFRWMKQNGKITKIPVRDSIASISVGIVKGVCMLDLSYIEDSNADVDMNIVFTGSGEFVEIQGTAEKRTFNDEQLAMMLNYAKKGIKELTDIQTKVLGTIDD